MFRRRLKQRPLPNLFAPWAEASWFASGIPVGVVMAIGFAVIFLKA